MEVETERVEPDPLSLQSIQRLVRDDDPFHRPELYIIREIYDAENPYENFEQQLERALAQETKTIVIEPFRLGDETSRWIAVGNWLHKTAVLTGFGSLMASFVWSHTPVVNVPLAVVSSLCTGLYSISWQFDPCCKYQVETDPKELSQLSLQSSLNNSSPVVLVRKDDTRRKILHTAVTIACLTQIGLRQWYPSMYRIFNPAYSNSLGNSSGSSSGAAGQIVVTSYSRHNPQMVPTSSTGFMSVLAEGVGILES